MASTIVPPNDPPPAAPKAYSDFSANFGWKLHELQFRLRAAHDQFTSGSAFDDQDMVQLGLSYVMAGVENELTELAEKIADSGFDYVSKEAARG